MMHDMNEHLYYLRYYTNNYILSVSQQQPVNDRVIASLHIHSIINRSTKQTQVIGHHVSDRMVRWIINYYDSPLTIRLILRPVPNAVCITLNIVFEFLPF